jgi:FkbM family methyltransferase
MNIDPILYDIFFKEYKVEDGDIVFSLGAGEGEEIEYLSSRVGPNGKVFAIEADPDIFKILQNNVSKYKYNNVTCLNKAITDSTGSTYIVKTENSIANYTSKDKKNNSHIVDCITMDKLVKDLGISKIDYIKINIEGDEIPFLKGFENNYSIVKNWCISCHDFTGIENQKTFDFVTNFFKQKKLEYRSYDSEYDYARFYVYVKNNV